MSITAEQFYSAMGKIRGDLPRKVRRFMATVAALGVKADFQGALNLRWERPAGPPINLGVIQRNGQIWTETVNAHAPPDIAHRYIQELRRPSACRSRRKPSKAPGRCATTIMRPASRMLPINSTCGLQPSSTSLPI